MDKIKKPSSSYDLINLNPLEITTIALGLKDRLERLMKLQEDIGPKKEITSKIERVQDILENLEFEERRFKVKLKRDIKGNSNKGYLDGCDDIIIKKGTELEVKVYNENNFYKFNACMEIINHSSKMIIPINCIEKVEEITNYKRKNSGYYDD